MIFPPLWGYFVTGTLAEQHCIPILMNRRFFGQQSQRKPASWPERSSRGAFPDEVSGRSVSPTSELCSAQGQERGAHDLGERYLKVGFGGAHTESNQRLMYTSAWASPQ